MQSQCISWDPRQTFLGKSYHVGWVWVRLWSERGLSAGAVSGWVGWRTSEHWQPSELCNGARTQPFETQSGLISQNSGNDFCESQLTTQNIEYLLVHAQYANAHVEMFTLVCSLREIRANATGQTLFKLFYPEVTLYHSITASLH